MNHTYNITRQVLSDLSKAKRQSFLSILPGKAMGESSEQHFWLKILVAKDENKVIMAESDQEFIQVLFSFMIMPIARVVKHTRTTSLSGDIGCLNNLYTNVQNLDNNFIQNLKFRDVVLNPRSAAEVYCEKLKPNLIESGCNDYYVCHDKDCKVISYYNLGKCRCGGDLKHKLTNNKRFFPEEEGVFTKSTARFLITDDFKVIPVATMADLTLVNELEKFGKIQERFIKIGRHEVLNLVKSSLRSRTPLSDTFMRQPVEDSSNTSGPRGMNPPLKLKEFWKKRHNICLKLIFDKVNNIVLYAVANEEFFNLLCTFLTIPLGYIFNQFPNLSFEGCMGNLHKSIENTDLNLFCCKERKEILVNPKLAPGLAYNSTNLICIEEATIPSECSAFSTLVAAKNRVLRSDSKPNQNVFQGFIKGPSTFLVTDDLEAKPLSPISVKLLLDRLMVPFTDIGKREVILHEEKAMRLLAASLASQQALTSTFLHKETDVECLDFLRKMWQGITGIGSNSYKSYKMV